MVLLSKRDLMAVKILKLSPNWKIFHGKLNLMQKSTPLKKNMDPRKKFAFSMASSRQKSCSSTMLLCQMEITCCWLLTKVSYGSYETLRLAEKQAISSSRSISSANRDYGAYIATLLNKADIVSE